VKKVDRKNAEEHIRNHISYPTTGDEIKMACSNMSHFSAADKRWMNEHLPAGRYENSEAVMRAMGW
jgi:hypothetical protein